LATVRKYRHTNIAEYRFGTQAQRHEGKVRISPLFVHFLKAQDRKRNYDTKITQLYINNLGRDRADFEGKKEVEATQALEDLEKDHSNIAVITLPADKGLLDRHAFASTQPSLVAEVVKDKFLNIASQNGPAGEKYKDFYISDRIRTLIFKNKDGGYDKISQETELLSLINESFVALKLDKTSLLSKAQEQAIWFHFVKFVLTDRIITSLNPGAINFSCKDAIDRGAASSAYYNLIKSFSTRAPLTRDEFDCALHAAATMVKGRGMNHHLNLVWNAVDAYVDANYNLIHNDDDKKWLIEWRDCNCPHERVLQLLKHRANQLYDELNDANVNQKFKICKALEILESIKTQSVTGLSGKRLLLEAAVRTPGIALGTCTEADIESYGKLADKLMINYPTLHIIGGLMKVLAGIALYIVSLSLAKKTSNKLFDSGLATAKAGYHACTRTGLQSLMKEQLETIKNEDKPKDSQPEGQLDEGGLSP